MILMLQSLFVYMRIMQLISVVILHDAGHVYAAATQHLEMQKDLTWHLYDSGVSIRAVYLWHVMMIQPCSNQHCQGWH